MKKIILLFLMIILFESVFSISINEIMYNPVGNDNNKEFIEIYSDGFVNLSGFIIEDLGGGDVLESLQYYNGDYSLIVEEGFDYTGITASIYSAGSTIGYYGLNNEWELIMLKNDSEIIDAVSYSNLWGGDGNNNSLCRVPDEIGVWQECKNSPGRSNVDSLSLGCDWTLQIIMNGSVFEDPEFQIKAVKLDGEGKANLTVDKWIEDSLGNIDKTYTPWSIENSLNYKTSSSYSPALAKGDAYFIIANITNISCIDYNTTNGYISKMFFVVDEEQSTRQDSYVKITDVDEGVEFGDIIDVKINVYRGDTAKYAVYIYVEDDDGKDVSEKSTLHFKDKFTNYSLTVPIQLDLNCNGGYRDGDYNVVIEGLDDKENKDIELGGKSSSCKTITSSVSVTSSSSSSSGFEYNLVSFPSSIKSGEEFEVEIEFQGDSDDHNIEIWSYVYRGSKSYSGEREQNKKSFVLDSDENRKVSLNNLVDAPEGDYNLKIKIRKDDQKTLKEITEEILVVEDSIKNISEIFQENIVNKDYIRWNPAVVYESSSYKARNLVPYLIIGVFGLLIVLLLLRY